MYTPNFSPSAPLKARLREFEKGAGAVRQAGAARRQAVLFVAVHFAERARVAVGQEHRIVAKSLVAARRPDQRAGNAALEVFDMAVRPGHAQRRDELGVALLRRERAAFAQLLFDRLHGAGEILVRSGPAG